MKYKGFDLKNIITFLKQKKTLNNISQNIIFYLNGLNEYKGHTVTNHGATLSLADIKGNTLQFDGVSSYVEVANANDLKGITNNFTFILMFQPSTLNQSNVYVLNKEMYAVLWEFVNNTMEFYSGYYTGTNPRNSASLPLEDTNPHIIIYSYNGTTFEGYVDGVKKFSLEETFSLTPRDENLIVGAALASAGFNSCKINDLLILNRGITQPEAEMLSKIIGWKHGINI